LYFSVFSVSLWSPQCVVVASAFPLPHNASMDERRVDPETGEIFVTVGPGPALMQRYEEAADALALLKAERTREREAILAPVKAALASLDAHYEGVIGDAELHVSQLLADLKAAVLNGQASVKGSRAQAVYVSGRVSWDTKQLDSYVTDHPELAAFRKVGPASVSIRTR
jgi:hypothetical protein